MRGRKPISHRATGAATSGAARERLKTGRNEPCPCGSGRKYKKCCLTADQRLARRAVPFADLDSSADHSEAAAPSGTQPRLDELWHELEAGESPSPEQVDALLDRLLALPPESTKWNQVFNTLAAREQIDLPGVFRRIADAVPPTEATRMSVFYWNAADEFARRGRRDLLPDIASRFRTLGDSYDPDVLWKIMETLMAEGLEAETLALAEHFLPIVRDDDQLMPWSVPQQCELIFELRVGRCQQNPSETPSTPEALAAELVRDLEDDIHPSVAHNAAAVVTGEAAAPSWTRAGFELAMLRTDADEEDELRWQEEAMRLHRVLIHVVREVWQTEQRAPGTVWWGLMRLCDSMDGDDGAGAPRRRNLLDCLEPAGMEALVARASREIIGVNVPRARLVLDALEVLLHVAERHALTSEKTAAGSTKELRRLRDVLSAL